MLVNMSDINILRRLINLHISKYDIDGEVIYYVFKCPFCNYTYSDIYLNEVMKDAYAHLIKHGEQNHDKA